MRIERLQIDGFGQFADSNLGPFESNIVVFNGPNEAGKSTLLAFVQSVLFGFGRRPGLRAIDPLAGGRHGGRITVMDTDGGRYTIERHAGVRGGPITVTMPDGTTAGQDALNRLIGFPAEVYCNVFSFDLQQLFEASSLENDTITTHLYGAGMGTDHLPTALRNLENEASAIFSARGRVQQVPSLVNEIEAIDSKLQHAIQEAQHYHGYRARLEEIDRERESLRQDLTIRRQRQQRLGDLMSSLDDRDALRTIEDRIANLPVIDTFPEDGIARLTSLETRIEAAEQEESKARIMLTALQENIARPVEDAALVEHQMDIDLLRSRLNSFQSWIDRLPGLKTEVDSTRRNLNEGLQEFGAGWDVARLEAFDTSIPVRDTVSVHLETLNQTAEQVRDAEHACQTASDEQRKAEVALDHARQQLTSGRAICDNRADLDKWGRSTRAAQAALADYQSAQQRATFSSAPQPVSSKNPARTCATIAAGGLLLFGAFSAIVGLAAGGPALPVGVVIGLLALAAGIWLLLRSLRAPAVPAEPVQTGSPRQSELEESRTRLLQALEPFNVTDPVQATQVLDEARDRIAFTGPALQQVEERSAEVRNRQHQLDNAQQRRDAARNNHDQATAAWASWLAERDLPADLSPGAVMTMFNRINELRRQQERLGGFEREARELASQIGEYRTRYKAVINALDETPAGSLQEIGAAVRGLIERYETVRAELSRRDTLREQLQPAEQDHQQRSTHLDTLRRQRTELLEHGGTTDAEEFRVRARQFDDRRQAEDARKEIVARLQRTAGNDWQQFQADLDRATADNLREQIACIEDEIRELNARLEQLGEEHGRLTAEMDRLANDETAVGLRARRQVLEEQLCEAASEWSTYTVAREILNRARQRYEQERQPEVLQTAERYFRSITGGRYTSLINPLGSSKIEVVRENGQRLTEDQLSRGTREQLYLSLRFGLITGFGKTSAHLPVIVDDILVNFDPTRARATAEAFAEMSRTNQILVFTCHPSTVEHFQSVSPDVQVVNLQPEAASVT